MNNLDTVRKAREDVFSLSENPLWTKVSTKDISNVILILSSSRSGSTLLVELLKQTNQVLSLQGEHVPLYKINGYSFPANKLESDQVSYLNISNFSQLSKDFVSEIGIGTDKPEFGQYALSAALRLIMQWPYLGFSAQEWLAYLEKARRSLFIKSISWDESRFFIETSMIIRRDGYSINPYYYDIPKEVSQMYFPTLPFPQGPPHPEFCIEEPPFIVVRSRRLPTVDEFKKKPLLLKASIDAYRVPLLRQIFPNARFKIIHLTRNPAAAINGLYDGWLDRGFFSHNVKQHATLSISGYSDLCEWGKYWWNFDLPPGWRTIVDHPLEYVCAFQWYNAHLNIIKQIMDEETEFIRVKMEDIIHSIQSRWRALSNITKFMQIEFDQTLQAFATNMPVVMATAVPYNQRWRIREKQIQPVITQSPIAKLARELGYASEENWL